MELHKQVHQGGVKSCIHDNCLVDEPIEVTLEDKATGLSLGDAKILLSGLTEAVARVERNETMLKGNGLTYNLAVISISGIGMSRHRSKLGSK